jgi:predicted N-formylglutamate amidohydrolase
LRGLWEMMNEFVLFGQRIKYDTDSQYGRFVYHDTKTPHYERIDVERMLGFLFRKNSSGANHLLGVYAAQIDFALGRTEKYSINEQQKRGLERTRDLIEMLKRAVEASELETAADRG